MSAEADMQGMIEKLLAVERIPEEAAKAVARTLEGELRKQIAAGQDPEGKAWKPTATGGRPLKNAGAALRVTTHGTTVVAQLTGPTAMHNLGAGRGGVKRQILPEKMPEKVGQVVQDTIRRALTR